jgi:hypothetical protein
MPQTREQHTAYMRRYRAKQRENLGIPQRGRQDHTNEILAHKEEYPELAGYREAFEPRPQLTGFGENKAGMPLICSSCGRPLDARRKCPVCDYAPDY